MDRLAGGERMTDLCREFGISRKTGNKFKTRFRASGARGPRRRVACTAVTPHKTPPEMMEIILAERRRHPTWGARKLKDVLERRLGRELPSHSVINTALGRAGLLRPRLKRHRHTPDPTSMRIVHAPNQVWCIDYKGQFRTGDGRYCYPLTVTDQHTRYILACEGMGAISDEGAREVCTEIFREWGLPSVMRSDNGPPFASTGLGGLTKLSVYLLRLDIELERIRPAHPEENGRHERMHRTLKAETTRPARANLLQQQERFDEWVDEFNRDRPHEALDMKRPAEVFVRSARPMPAKLPELAYPTHDDTILVNPTGGIYIAGIGKIHVTKALSGEHLGIREQDDGRWLVSFARRDLGVVDRAKTLRPLSTSQPT